MVRGIKKGAALAINQAAIANAPESFEKMERVGPKVCLTTANEPGFLGFHAFLQTGVHPLGGRFGAAKLINADSMEAVIESPLNLRLNPLNLWQYTVWEDAEAHERMHYEQYERIFELCAGCLDMVVDGPWEPVYRILEEDMPRLMGMTDDYNTPPIPIGGPKQYLVHTEWESPDTLLFGLTLTGVNPELRKIHDEGVMAHLARLPPYYRIFAPAMEDMIFFH